MAIFLLASCLSIFMLSSSMVLMKADTPIQRRMVGGNVTFPWIIHSEDNFGKILFAPNKKTIIRIDKDSKPVYEHPFLYKDRVSLLTDGVILRDLSNSDEGLYKSQVPNHLIMNNTMLFVYTEMELQPQILVGDRLLTPITTHTELQVQENIKIYAGQDLYTNILLQPKSSFCNTTSCANVPMCVYHVKMSTVLDFNTNISVSVMVDYGFYYIERNFTISVNATSDDTTKVCEKNVGLFILGPISIILLALLVWSTKHLVRKFKRDHSRTRGNPERMPLRKEEWSSSLEVMLSEAKIADENKLAELRKNFRDHYLDDLCRDGSPGGGKWNQYDSFHCEQICKLINLFTENSPPDNAITFNQCFDFALFCLYKWSDNSDIVANVLMGLFNLTKLKRAQDKISKTLHLRTMISEAKKADVNKQELRENFRDHYLNDLCRDESLDDNKWDRFDCFHSRQIWELINLLTENGPYDNPITLKDCISFAQICLEKCKDEDNYDMVEIILLALFNLTKCNLEQHSISRKYLDTTAHFLHSKRQRVSFLCCRYLVLIFCTELYTQIENYEEWKPYIRAEIFHTIENWRLEEHCFPNKKKKKFRDIQYWLERKDEPAIQYFALWLLQKYLYEKVDIRLLKQDINVDSFKLVLDPRLKSIVDQVQDQYRYALLNLEMGEW